MKGQIIMSTKELNRISILEKALKEKISSKEGARIIGVTTRQFRRLKKRYREKGVKGIIHKARGRKSNRAIPKAIKDYAISIVREEYSDFGPTLAHEKLSENHNIEFSVETLRKEMIKAGIWKPKKRRKGSVHQLRERRYQEGELVQVDGSPHKWFEDRGMECTLLVYIDDATGKLLWMEFAESESREAYFKATGKYIGLHGRPLSFYVDKHSVFRVNTTKTDSASVNDSNGDTQFGRAMRELDIELIFANTPQAKGRVERVNKTLQDRLVKEMRLLGISSIEEGNKYLPKFIQEFNKKFSIEARSNINAHRPILEEQKLEEILCIKDTRVLTRNLMMQYKNKTYKIELDEGYEYTMRRARVNVIEKNSGEIQIRYKGKKLKYSVTKVRKKTKVYNSKNINKRVEEVKIKQGRSFQFNLFGRTFLLWRKPDISILD